MLPRTGGHDESFAPLAVLALATAAALGPLGGCGASSAGDGAGQGPGDAGAGDDGSPSGDGGEAGTSDGSREGGDATVDSGDGAPCAAGLTLCSGACIDTGHDDANCGSCGHACGIQEQCSAGACAPVCPPGLVACSGACLDPTTSTRHCGATPGCGVGAGSGGMPCGPGWACSPTDAGGRACMPTCGTCVPPGLIRWYPLDGDTLDYSGSGKDLTNVGATPSADRDGHAAGAYAFDGATSYMVADGTGIPFGTDARTITAWVHPTATVATPKSAGGFITTGKGNCPGLMFGMGRTVGDAGPAADLYFWGGCDDVDSGLALAEGAWSFAALVWDGTTITQYVNGASASATRAFTTAPSHLWVGLETTTDDTMGIRFHFTGDLDDIRVFDRALSAAEIAEVRALP